MNLQVRNSKYLFNYVFITALATLAVNDHVLKTAFGNAITGKLSDVAGMVVLPLFLAFVFPKLKTRAVWVSMLLFAFWKSEFSQGMLDFCNSFLPIAIGRVVDYPDLFAFAIVPLPYYIIWNHPKLDFLMIHNARFSAGWLVAPCVLILVATSPPRGYFHKKYRPATGNIVFKDTHVTFSISKEQLLQKLSDNGLIYIADSLGPVNEAERDTAMYRVYQSKGYIRDTVTYEQFRQQADEQWERRSARYASDFYRIRELITDKDTIRELQFYILHTERGKNQVYLSSMVTRKDISDIDVREKETRRYKKLLKKYFKKLD